MYTKKKKKKNGIIHVVSGRRSRHSRRLGVDTQTLLRVYIICAGRRARCATCTWVVRTPAMYSVADGRLITIKMIC